MSRKQVKINQITDLQENLETKQNTLVSGTNIKTLNGTSLLGSGDIVIAGGGIPANTDITINKALIGNGENTYDNNGLWNYKWGIENFTNNYYGKFLVAIGTYALYNNGTGSHNTAIGNYALQACTGTTGCNTAVGSYAAKSNDGANHNTAIGYQALCINGAGSGSYNTVIGSMAMYQNNSGSGGQYNTAIGYQAQYSNTYNNTTSIGYNSYTTGSNQVQLGDSSTTTYVYGTVQNRSDIRDKAEVKDTELGLEFVLSLRPVDFKWNLREDYITRETIEKDVEVTLKDGTIKTIKEQVVIEKELPNDGSKTRSRFHHGFIAQDFEGKDFGGFQDHSIKGGGDVMSLGYDEFIAPLVKAIQEQQEMIKSLKQEIEELKNK